MNGPGRGAGTHALLRFLARQGRLVGDEVARIEGLVQESGTSVHEVLEREGVIGQKDLALLLAETLRLRIVDLTTYPLDPNVTRELKETVATRYEVVPIGIDGRTIEVVTANPLDIDGLKAVEFATGKRVQAVVATHVEVTDALAHTYRLQESLEQFLQLVPANESLVVNELSDEGDDLRTIAADAELPPVIKLADKMLIEGIKSRASDVHVEPEGDSVLVRYRVDGILEEAFRFPKWIQNPLVARLKVMAKLDITERRVPQDGRIQVRYLDKTVDMRVSSLPAQHGEKITLRILDASQSVKVLDRLGFSAADLKVLRDAARKPQGMILITGPTGSGKTTTLYALLREIFSPKTNIVTIENPIEYQLKGINQVEVNEKQGLTFGGVLRSVLRQDPDVILLGEIRDKETAQIAFQAASTGHLVLSTVHTNDAAGAVTRLMDLGLEPYAIASALHLVVAQRLVRQLCPTCCRPAAIEPELARQLHVDASVAVKGPGGCAQCRHTGYRSRIGVYEMLPMTPAITKLIEAGAGETMVRQQARSDGAHTLLEDAVGKLQSGLTSVEELQRVVQIVENAGTQCPGCRKEIAEDYSVCPHCSRVLRASCGGCAKPLDSAWVRCPYCGVAADAAAPPPDAGPAPARRSFTALVVDDTSTIRDVVRHALEHSDLGLTVVTAEDGPQALELAGRERPDIVILDISMPGMDGFEVCRRLRSEMRTAFVPVLMLTAHDSEDDVARGFGVGADDYMVKPFRREGLLARVRRILERTYGSQAIGAPPLPEPPAATAAAVPASVDAVASDLGVQAALGDLAADRDALRRAIASCEARLEEIAARLTVEPAVPVAAPADPAAMAELQATIAELRASHEQALAEVRAETTRVRRLAEEALQGAAAASAALPTAQFGTLMAAVERLQGEHVRLASSVTAAQADAGRPDEECERRLRQATEEIAALRADVATIGASWEREADAVRADARSAAEQASAGVLAEMRDAVEAVRRRSEEDARTAAEEGQQQARAELRAATDALHEQVRSDVRAATADLRQQAQAAVEGVGRRVDAAIEELGCGLARTDRALGELRDVADAYAAQHARDAERLAAAEEMARRSRDEGAAMCGQMAGEVAGLRQAHADGRAAAAALAARVDAAEAAARQAHDEAAALAARMKAELGAQLDAALAEVHRILAEEAAERRATTERVASVEAAARGWAAETAAASEQTGRDLVALREAVLAQQVAQRAEIDWLQRAVIQLRRVAVKLARRMRAAARTVEVRALTHADARAAAGAADGAALRAETWAALAALREQYAVLAARAEAAPPDDGAGDATSRELETLRGAMTRLEADHHRHAQDVEARLRGLMRTAAGGFDVQLALLRGKVEVLARTLRERMPVEGVAPADDAMLQHRESLLDRLREQVAALQPGAEWRPQRVLDLLLDSTLAAAVTPLRRILQRAWGNDAEPAPRGPDDVTDESASPS